MQDFLEYKDKIKSIKYDNGLDELINKLWLNISSLEDITTYTYESTNINPIQTLTIDFGDCEFEIVGKVTWKLKTN
jgi:hypothetical protein